MKWVFSAANPCNPFFREYPLGFGPNLMYTYKYLSFFSPDDFGGGKEEKSELFFGGAASSLGTTLSGSLIEDDLGGGSLFANPFAPPFGGGSDENKDFF